MTVDDVRELALSFAGVSESRPFAPDRVVFKTTANNKVFAILSGHEFPDDQVTVKADPERVIELLERFEAVHPAYKLNKRHWVNISLAGDVPDELIQKLIGDSHDLVAP
ncbi:MmcQ/YjbR family DNA-binding protein [Streptomyces sp. NPDC048045]|uniref:MmcQ/YjbR family DNA-binding protein n=1 Tax=Streptomyces sp. NPDC048045 TaxID=3154710 RepID=UPI00341CF69A